MAPECMVIGMDLTVDRVYGDQQWALSNAHSGAFRRIATPASARRVT